MNLSDRDQYLATQLAGRHLFITGGTGFVGRTLLDTFSRAHTTGSTGFRVAVLSREPAVFLQRHPEFAKQPWLTMVPGSLTDLPLAPQGYTDIIHAAADTHASGLGANWIAQIVGGTEAMLALALRNGAKRFLLTSSGAIYGAQPSDLLRLKEDYNGAPSTTSPHSIYGQAKRVAEQLCTAAHEETGLQTVIARCFAFAGRHIPVNGPYAIENFIRNAMNGEDIRIRGNGKAVRSYLAGEDMADWLLTLLFEGTPGEAYNVGSDVEVSMVDLATMVVSLLAPDRKVIVESAVDDAQRSRYVPAIGKAQALGLNVRVTLPDIITRTASSLQAQQALTGSGQA